MGFHPYMGCERACSPQGLLSGPCGVACKGRAYAQVQTCVTSDMSLLVNGTHDGTPVQVLSTSGGSIPLCWLLFPVGLQPLKPQALVLALLGPAFSVAWDRELGMGLKGGS